MDLLPEGVPPPGQPEAVLEDAPEDLSPKTRERASAVGGDGRLGDPALRPGSPIKLEVAAAPSPSCLELSEEDEAALDAKYKPGPDWRQLRRSDAPSVDEASVSAAIDAEARARRDKRKSDFPWIGRAAMIEPKVPWASFYAEEAADAGYAAPVLDPEPEPEPERPPPEEDFGLRAWAPTSASSSLDQLLAEAEAKKMLLDVELARATGSADDGAKPVGTHAPSTPPPRESDSNSGAPAVADAVAADVVSASHDKLEGVRGAGDWFCAARLRHHAAASWDEFVTQAPVQARAVQPIVEAWLLDKQAARRAILEKNAFESGRVTAWLKSLQLDMHEEIVREYIGAEGGLSDLMELEQDDLKDLVMDLDLEDAEAIELRKAVVELKRGGGGASLPATAPITVNPPLGRQRYPSVDEPESDIAGPASPRNLLRT